ncbi:MFS transporter [Bifidobacterium psychraerophilum]|jgi:DHA1 family arabinose polymer transporter-like MFS transporter|uniref:MFS transporter n=1 Tax=Bifidobacterium psychraerophilum TaxID=218140 RepID=UPI0023EF6368|nr:MFS transporter [Bifidobacterium psychraerophilum]MCI1660425.1 MFS transporter [Bifidobacterium psychraerophilum]MCI1804082.1 MFS transporter [Bifidobacterium psychraerophilum]MCI2176557.1 MFS transporter [Bifidobacterium psychraerophilum]MCI2182303.1 MFS transporter [Bifidobacterium psychraerophilum]
MKKSLIALASGAFALGAAEFVMMGILPQSAHAMQVSIPEAGHFISAYAIGVCVGTLILVFGRRVPPKRLIVIFMILIIIGNLLSAASVNAPMLILARFVAGLPHGAFFGTATLIAKSVADPGKEAKAVSLMITGQTVANMLGVPAGTLLAQYLSWRMTFAALSAWAVLTLFLVMIWVPDIAAIKDAGIAGQFRFLRRRGPWLILGAVFLGNAGVFCWWSYVSPWLVTVGGYPAEIVPLLMMLAGFGMVVGGLAGGTLTDKWRHAGTAALGQAISGIGLLLVFLVPGSMLSTGLFTFWVAFGLFFISSPQQILMVEAGKGGGELIGGAAVQVAFNLGNAVGSIVGGATLAARNDYHLPALAGVPFAVAAVVLLIVYSWRHETHTDALQRMRQIHSAEIGSTPEQA